MDRKQASKFFTAFEEDELNEGLDREDAASFVYKNRKALQGLYRKAEGLAIVRCSQKAIKDDHLFGDYFMDHFNDDAELKAVLGPYLKSYGVEVGEIASQLTEDKDVFEGQNSAWKMVTAFLLEALEKAQHEFERPIR